MRRSFAIGWLALPPVWLGAVLLRPARFSCFGTATPEDETSAYLEKVVVELDAQEGLQETLSQIDRLESDIKHLPTQPEFAELQADMRAMKATQDAIQRETHTARLALTRIEDHLLKRG